MTSHLLPSLVAPFDAEWRRVRCDPDALRRARTWHVVEGPLESLDQVLTAVGFDRPPSDDTERNLARLVGHAGDDQLAAQVVVRRLLPGVLSVAGRRRRAGCRDAAEELFGALWIAVRTYDARRRPASLAAALLADADYRAFRSGWRRRSCIEVPCERVADRPDTGPGPDPADELRELIDDWAAGGDAVRDDLELLHCLLAEPSPTRAARELQISERTVRNRRDRLAAKLRQVAQSAA